MDVAAVLAAHDEQVRRDLRAPRGFVAEAVGRVVRLTAPPGSTSSYVEFSDLDEHTADDEISAQLAYFRARGQAFEWKTYGRDRPGDLGARLARAGFVAGDPETFVVGQVVDVLAATDGHDAVPGVELRDAVRADLPGLRALSQTVWDDEADGLLRELFAARDEDPDAIAILVAVSGGTIVSSGWVRLPPCQFASLWGGSTHPTFRSRGIYRVLVRRRALLAAARGHRYLQVDCTPASRPILERLALHAVDTTTPYRWRPDGPLGPMTP